MTNDFKMPSETASQAIELTDFTCRLCLANDREITPLIFALSQEESTNIIQNLLKIDLNDGSPFQNACSECVANVRLMENMRNEFDRNNKFFDVMWTQYKRIHFPEPIPTPKKGRPKLLKQSPQSEKNTEEYVIDEHEIVNTEIEYVQSENNDVYIKSEDQEIIIEHDGIDDASSTAADEYYTLDENVQEEYVYEEIMDDSRMQEEYLIEDAKDDFLINDDSSQSAKSIIMQEDTGYYDKTVPTCYICLERFECFDDVTSHLNEAHVDLLPFHCDKCLGYFNTIEEVNKHYISHVYEFICLYCPRRYCSEQYLANHNLACNALKCPLCDAHFELQSHLKVHLRQAHPAEAKMSGRKKNVCGRCGKRFTLACNLARHFKSKSCTKQSEVLKQKKAQVKPDGSMEENEEEKEEQGNEDDKDLKITQSLTCQVCSKKLGSNSGLARHIEREHAEFNIPLFSCNLCPKKFTTFEKCTRHRAFHRNSKRPIVPVTKKDPSQNTCKICNKQFRLDNMLLKHLSEVHQLALELFQCEQCGRKFSTEPKLRKHEYNSHRENKTLYVCSHCGKKFEKRLTLKDHETKHLNAPAYQCNICLKTFIHKNNYDRHSIVHSEEKNFVCEFCNKAFKRNTTLVVHRRIHTGEKPYECEICGQCFIDCSTIIKHRQRMHPEAAAKSKSEFE